MTTRVALVTGGTGGIGTAICRELARQGHKVATNYRDEAKANAWRDAQKAAGFEFTLVKGDVSDPVAAEAMVREYRLVVTPEAFAAHVMEAVVPELARAAEPMPGALDTVSAASAWGGPLAIASSSERVIVETVASRFGWDRAIRVRCTGDEVARAKPAPDLFLHCAATFAVEPARCLVVDDSQHGVAAAVAAGMTAIGFVDPADPRDGRHAVLSSAGASLVVAGAEELGLVIGRISEPETVGLKEKLR